MKTHKLPFVGLFCLLTFAKTTSAQTPTISSFSPGSGNSGTTVVLTGTNFSTTAANNVVYFGAAKASVSASTATSCTVTVPAGATHQPISLAVGLYTGYSSKPFIVTNPCTDGFYSSSYDTSSFSFSGNPYYSILGDFDQDGKNDVVLSKSGAQQITFYRNTSTTGSITFGTAYNRGTGVGPRTLATGDLNGDGALDVVCYYQTNGNMGAFENTSTVGSIVTGLGVNFEFTTATNTGNGGITIGDLDGDGKPDIVAALGTADSIGILRNTNSTVGGAFTSGSFATSVLYKVNGTPSFVYLRDIDGDGKSDIVTTCFGSDQVAVLRNTCTPGTISFASPVYFTVGDGPHDFDIGDIDGDGKQDIAVPCMNGNTISVLRNTSTSGNISFETHDSYSAGTSPRDLKINDMNGDGKLDVLVLNTLSDNVFIYKNTATSGTIDASSFAAAIAYALKSGSNPQFFSIGDLDTDAKPDVLTSDLNFDRVSFMNSNVLGGPIMTSASTKSICSGTNVNLTLTANPSSGTTYSWIASNNTNVTGESTTSQTGSVITNTLTNTNNLSQTVIYTVTPTSSTTCSGGTPQPQTVTVTINSVPAINTMTAAVCSGATFTVTPVNGTNGTVPPPTTYSWSAPSVTGGMTGGASGSGASNITGTLTNTTSTTQTATYTVTPFASGCTGSTFTVTVSIYPKPSMTSAGSKIICSATNVNLALTSNLTSTYSWIAADNSNTSGESTTAQSGNTINNTISNSSTSVQNVIYTVTPTSTLGSCAGTAQTVTITVNPAPAMTSASTKAICGSSSVNLALTSNISANYSWLATDNTNITGESTTTQTGSTITNTLTSSISSSTNVVYTVTPTSTANSCVGTTQTITVTVNPLPSMTSASSHTSCSNASINFNLTSNISSTYSWLTASNSNVTGESTTTQSGASITDVPVSSLTTSTTLVYTVTPTSTATCVGAAQTLTVTVNPHPAMTSSSSTSKCSGGIVSITLTSNIASNYSWLATDNTSVTGESTTLQTSSVLNNTLTSTATNSTVVNYTVTPVSTAGCTGIPQVVTVTVNPKPVMTSASSVGICSQSAINLTLTSGAGATYSWLTTDNTNTTGESTSAQSTSTISDVISNGLNTPTTLIYTVTPTSTTGNCTGTSQTVTVTVNPKPVMTSASSISICSGTQVNLGLTASASSSFTWLATGIAEIFGESTTIQSSSTITNTLINDVLYPIDVIYTVTPTGTSGSCAGPAQTVTVTVNPQPYMTSANSTNVCSQTALNFLLTSDASATYSWLTSNNASTTGESTTAQAGNHITDNINSVFAGATTLVYTVTPTGTAGSCVGVAQTVTVTVNPKPVMNSASSVAICSGNPVGLVLSSAASATYSWLTTANSNVTGESTTAQNSFFLNNTLTSSLTTPVSLIYTVTPTGTNGACLGTVQNVTVTVNPIPSMTSANSKTVCSGSSVNLSLTSSASASYGWITDAQTNLSGGSTTSQTGSVITNTLTSSSTSILSTVYTVTPTGTAGGCVGSAQTVTVTVDNAPPAATAGTDVNQCSSSLNLSGNNPFPGTGTWTNVSQSVPTFTTTIYSPTAYNSLVGFSNFLTGNNVTLRWTVTSQLGVCPATTDDVVVTKISCPLTSAFTTSDNSLCIKPGGTATVVFTDNSSPGAFPPIGSYTWTFNGGTPSTATGPGPHTITYNYTATQTTYAASLTIVDANSNQNTSTQLVTVNPLPSAAGSISGAATVCQGQNNVNYSVASITNANSYVWILPSGASATNPTSAAQVDFATNATSGMIKVAGVNACGNGDTSSLAVTVNPLPGAAGTLSGTSPVCQGQSGVNYLLSSVSNASGYIWTFPGGGSTNGTSNAISANFNTSAVSGMIVVTPTNSCGSGTSSSFSLTVNPLPSAAGSISGAATVCAGDIGSPYAIAAISNATSYNWSFPSGITGSGSSNTQSVDFATSATSGTFTVTGINACGSGAPSVLSVTVNPLPDAAGSISGPGNVCAGSTGINYSIASVANTVGYNWAFPAGANSVNPNNIASTDFSAAASSGMIIVTPYNACGNGSSSSLSVIVNPLPDAAGSISGNATVCQGVNGSAFSIASVNNASSYTWTFPSGITVNGNGPSITVDLSNTAVSGVVNVVPNNSCGNGAASTVNLTVNPLPDAAGIITGATQVCENTPAEPYSIATINNASAYAWNFPSGFSVSGSGNSINALIASGASSGNLIVYGSNSCGNGPSAVLNITVNTVPAQPGSISGPATICAGSTGINYSVPAVVGASGYSWFFPTGISSVNPNNNANADFSTTAQSGIISVAAVNSCGTGTITTMSVTVNPLPDAASSITGSGVVCQGTNGVQYFVNPIANANSYVWTTPSGSTLMGSGNNPGVDYSTTALSGNISVYGQNSCGNGVASTLTVVVNPLPSAPVFSGSMNIQGCPLPDSLLFSVPSAANALSYNWLLPAGAYANGSTTDDSVSVGFNSVGINDTLQVASVNACGSSSYSYMLLNLLPLTTPSICMVSVDSLSMYNEIYWDKIGFAQGDTFIVYRDTANNNYAPIGKVPFDSLSMFTDTVRTLYAANGDPNVSSWRYKIAVEDSCGQMSAMSLYHQTMFFQDATGNFSWNHYEIEGQITPVPVLINYNFKRDDFSTGAWNTIQTLSASSTAYTDPNYTTYQGTGSWRVQTNWTNTCNPTMRINPVNGVYTIVNTSRSNIKNQMLNPGTTTQQQEETITDVLVYPNPAKDAVTIETGDKSSVVEVLDAQGRMIFSEKLNGNKLLLSTGQLANGVYIVRINSGTKAINKKLIVEH